MTVRTTWLNIIKNKIIKKIPTLKSNLSHKNMKNFLNGMKFKFISSIDKTHYTQIFCFIVPCIPLHSWVLVCSVTRFQNMRESHYSGTTLKYNCILCFFVTLQKKKKPNISVFLVFKSNIYILQIMCVTSFPFG